MTIEKAKHIIIFKNGFTLTDETVNEQMNLKEHFGECAEESYVVKSTLVEKTQKHLAVKVEFEGKEMFGFTQECWDGTWHANQMLTKEEFYELLK